MTKWIKRLALLALTLALLIGGGLYYAYQAANTRPDWYDPITAAPAAGAERTAAANRVLGDLAAVNNELDRQQAELAAGVAEEPEAFQLTFAESDLNAWLAEWGTWAKVEDAADGQLQDIVVRLRDNKLLLAGTLTERDVVAALHIEPLPGETGTSVQLTRVTAGRLPLPQRMWGRWRDPLVAELEKSVARHEPAAALTADGANVAAAQLLWGRLLIDLLDGRPAGPDVLLYLQRNDAWLPARIENIDIGDGDVTITVRPLTIEEAANLLQPVER
jgi:hypothetical protein